MQRRDFLKLASLSAAGAATPAAMIGQASVSDAPTRKPNVIFIVSDQHRAGLAQL